MDKAEYVFEKLAGIRDVAKRGVELLKGTKLNKLKNDLISAEDTMNRVNNVPMKDLNTIWAEKTMNDYSRAYSNVKKEKKLVRNTRIGAAAVGTAALTGGVIGGKKLTEKKAEYVFEKIALSPQLVRRAMQGRYAKIDKLINKTHGQVDRMLHDTAERSKKGSEYWGEHYDMIDDTNADRATELFMKELNKKRGK